METTTYFVYLPELDIAFDQDKINELSNALDKLLGVGKSVLTINHTPLNQICKFTVAIYSLDRTEESNRNIMNKIEDWLSEKSIFYKEYTSKLRWDDNDKVFIELEVRLEEQM